MWELRHLLHVWQICLANASADADASACWAWSLRKRRIANLSAAMGARGRWQAAQQRLNKPCHMKLQGLLGSRIAAGLSRCRLPQDRVWTPS